MVAGIFPQAQPGRPRGPTTGPRRTRTNCFGALPRCLKSRRRATTLVLEARLGSGPAPDVDVAHPTVYRRLAFTRYGGHVLLQLVYTVWFPERPPERSLDLLAGKLNGLVFRVTLDPRDTPLIYDRIHPCGCYHMVFPTVRAKAKPSPRPRHRMGVRAGDLAGGRLFMAHRAPRSEPLALPRQPQLRGGRPRDPLSLRPR